MNEISVVWDAAIYRNGCNVAEVCSLENYISQSLSVQECRPRKKQISFILHLHHNISLYCISRLTCG